MKRLILGIILTMSVILQSCVESVESLPPYTGCHGIFGFHEWANQNLIPELDTTLGWDSVFTHVLKCQVTVNAPSMLMVQHPLITNEMIALGTYCQAGIYDELIPFDSAGVTFVHLRSWESNFPISQSCDIGGGVACIKNGVLPIPNEDHPWCSNDYTNWTFILGNPDCICIAPMNDTFNLFCEWRQ